MKGISSLSRVTGREHDQISRFLLGIIIDIRLPNNMHSGRLLAAVRSILDFVYLAQYPMHTDETLELLNDALSSFHDNKSIFVDLGVRSTFNLPKLHSCTHYVPYIKLFGTTDNSNTEYTERLHIDLAKDAFRSTNFKDEFPQMTLWLERKEKHPTAKSVRFNIILDKYGATSFRDALARYLLHHMDPSLSYTALRDKAPYLIIPFNRIPVYHRIKYTTPDPYAPGGPSDNIVDSVHVEPTRLDPEGNTIPGRFDTVLVNDGTGELTGTKGYRVAQVRVVFSIPPRLSKTRSICALYLEQTPPLLSPPHASHPLAAFTSRYRALPPATPVLEEPRLSTRRCLARLHDPVLLPPPLPKPHPQTRVAPFARRVEQLADADCHPHLLLLPQH
ncbi:hypothetical protein MKEN_00625400 [Mycena kentingensis (nom. inval.)]|nr:hypothetical protein MKEN_00625400 [Mycena kentingensis (nom. inval.)]